MAIFGSSGYLYLVLLVPFFQFAAGFSPLLHHTNPVYLSRGVGSTIKLRQLGVSNHRKCMSRITCLEFAQPEFVTFPQKMFTLVNFAVLPFWGMMIATPKSEITKNLMTSTWPILLLMGIHLSLVSFGLTQPGSAQEFEFLATQGFVKLSAMMEMRNFPVFVSEEWAHVLAWDLFVGRWIYLDGLKKDIPTPHSLFFCFLLGPLGLLMHLVTRALLKRDLGTFFNLD
jgi:hypothetical protein